jgi:hypothetical protein
MLRLRDQEVARRFEGRFHARSVALIPFDRISSGHDDLPRQLYHT